MNYEETEDEQTDEDALARDNWVEVAALWESKGHKCQCGRDISLEDAYYLGQCEACLCDANDGIPF